MMRKPGRKWIVLGMAAVLTLGMSTTAFAQSDGIADYSSTYVTDGVKRDYYAPGEMYWSSELCEFDNKNFTITINYQDADYCPEGWTSHFTGVWMGKIEEGRYVRPFTDNPWEMVGVEVHALSENVFDLSGLDIQEGVEYGLFIEMFAEPPRETGNKTNGFISANAGGGVAMATYATFFRINSPAAADTGTAGAQTTGGSDTGSSSRGDDVSYYWAHNDIGWWVQATDGTYLVSRWFTSPESGLYYYLGADGYMLTDTMTPDGYYVNADGAWVP